MPAEQKKITILQNIYTEQIPMGQKNGNQNEVASSFWHYIYFMLIANNVYTRVYECIFLILNEIAKKENYA